MAIGTTRHSQLSGEDVGPIYWKAVADTSARTSLTIGTDDIGRVVWQEDNDSFWIVLTTSPTFVEITAAGAAAVTSVAGRTGDVTLTSADVGLDNVANTLHKFDATADPVVGDDTADGYSAGSIWVNTSTPEAFICSDASTGAAVWTSLTAGGGGGGTVDVVSNVATSRILGRTTAGSGDSEELTAAQVRTLINVEDGAVAAGATGDAHASSGGSDHADVFLKDGSRAMTGALTGVTGIVFTEASAAGSNDIYVDDGTNYTAGTLVIPVQSVFAQPTAFGEPGNEQGGININGVTYDANVKLNEFGGTADAQLVVHRHSTTIGANTVYARSKSNDETHATLALSDEIATLFFVGHTGSHYDFASKIVAAVDDSGTVSATSLPGKLEFYTCADGSTTPTLALTLSANKTATFVGNLVTSGTIDGRDVAADGTKLDTIEESADVTDTANVTAAGALMDSEVNSLSGVKTLTVPDSTTISAFGKTLVDDADAAAARTTLGVDPSAANVYTVGANQPYTTIADAITAVNLGSWSSSNRPVVLVHPGYYTMTAQVTVPQYCTIQGVNKFAVQLYNNTTDMFLLSDDVLLSDFLIEGGADPELWAIDCNDASNTHIRRVDMLNNGGAARQHFLKQNGSTWVTHFVEDCIVDYYAQTEPTLAPWAFWYDNEAAATRNVDAIINNVFVDSFQLTESGGGFLVQGCADFRIRNSTIRGEATYNTGVRVETSGATGSPQVDIRHSWLGGGPGSEDDPGVSIYADTGTTVRTSQVYAPNASYSGTHVDEDGTAGGSRSYALNLGGRVFAAAASTWYTQDYYSPWSDGANYDVAGGSGADPTPANFSYGCTYLAPYDMTLSDIILHFNVSNAAVEGDFRLYKIAVTDGGSGAGTWTQLGSDFSVDGASSITQVNILSQSGLSDSVSAGDKLVVAYKTSNTETSVGLQFSLVANFTESV